MNQMQKQLLRNSDFRNTVQRVLSKRYDNRSFVYYLDSKDRIVCIDNSFTEFALENSAGSLMQDVEFSNIWQYISGKGVRYIYRELFKEIRESSREIEFPFRCDSPYEKRFMKMKMIPLTEGKIGFISHLIRTERYETQNRLLDMHLERDSRHILMCSWCKAIEISMEKKKEWVDIEKGIEYYRLFAEKRMPAISHGICPDCASQFKI
ncbi:MAG: hypothetical protein SVK54_05785 [candidate division WOR-3 bacterium]|nr:hypothetical protein [candidate division WOR-3 bacterium]